MHDLGASVLEPPEAFPQAALHLPLHSVSLVSRHPLLPLQLRVTEAPPRLGGGGAGGALALLELDLFRSLVAALGGSIGCTVAPEVMRA